MAIAVKREGRMVDYFVEATHDDLTPATVGDLLAARPMAELREPREPEALPAPMYVPRNRRARPWALVLSLVVNLVLLEALVRVVVGNR